jgi:hypothetical protein
MDETFGSVAWADQFALQGFRIAVPNNEAAIARAMFSQVRAIRPRRRDYAHGFVWRAAAIISSLLFNLYLGWLVVSWLRPRSTRGSGMLAGVAIASGASLVLVAAMLAVSVALLLLASTISGRPLFQ